jgi:hypothetical protein
VGTLDNSVKIVINNFGSEDLRALHEPGTAKRLADAVRGQPPTEGARALLRVLQQIVWGETKENRNIRGVPTMRDIGVKTASGWENQPVVMVTRAMVGVVATGIRAHEASARRGERTYGAEATELEEKGGSISYEAKVVDMTREIARANEAATDDDDHYVYRK